MRPNKYFDFIFMLLGIFAIITGLAVIISFVNDSLTYDKFIYASVVFIVYFLLILIRKRIEKK